MIIKILGSGCKKCEKLEANARLAVDELGLDARFEKVSDFKDIAKYGVMQTPALVINEKVEAFGKVPSVKKIKDILRA